MNPLLPFEWIAALRFLREGRMQSILIVLGVAIGVAVIVFMSALLSGLQGNIVRRTLSAQSHIQVLPPDDVARALRAGGGAEPPVTAIVQPKAQRLRSIDQWQKLRDRVEMLPDVVAVSPQVSGPGFAVRGEANKSVTLIGIELERYLRIVNLADKLVSGAVRVGGGEALIGTELAKDLGIGVGDKFRISTASGASDTLTVAGIFDLGNKGANQRNLYVGLALAQSMLNLVGGVSSIDINVREPFGAEATARSIEAETGLKAESWIQTNAQFFTALAAQTFTNRAIRAFVALTVAFGIASVLVVSVVQKSKEIGILRAMGTSRGQVLRLFLIQGGVVGFLGSLLGSALAYAFLLVWRGIARNPDGTPLFILDIEPSLVISTAVGAALVGVLSAVMPARRAAALDPVVAIRG
jgi:lipoprotein-releasing system permease protein